MATNYGENCLNGYLRKLLDKFPTALNHLVITIGNSGLTIKNSSYSVVEVFPEKGWLRLKVKCSSLGRTVDWGFDPTATSCKIISISKTGLGKIGGLTHRPILEITVMDPEWRA